MTTHNVGGTDSWPATALLSLWLICLVCCASAPSGQSNPPVVVEPKKEHVEVMALVRVRSLVECESICQKPRLCLASRVADFCAQKCRFSSDCSEGLVCACLPGHERDCAGPDREDHRFCRPKLQHPIDFGITGETNDGERQ